MAAHYSKEWWFPDAAGTLAKNQRAIVFGPGDDNVLATIYSDAGLTIPLANPTVTDATTGILDFYVPDGTDSYWIFVGPVGLGDSEEWSPAGDGPYVEIAGDMMTGALQVNETGESPGYPIGPPVNALDTGIDILSSFLGGDDDGNPAHYDSTGRLNLYSYQRANFSSWGESIRFFLMKANAKIMQSWYFPDGGYDGSGDPVGDFVPVVWAGAHWEANNGLSLHKHWSVETPDVTGAIQTRFEVRYGDPNVSNAIAGLDKTIVATNLADFVVRCSNDQELRLSANDTYNKQIMFSLDHEGDDAYRRFALRVTSTDADFHFRRYNDSGVFQDSPIIMTRSTGLISIGGTSGTAGGLLVTKNGGVAVTVTPLATGGQAFLTTGTDATARAYQGNVSGDANIRFVGYVDGKLEWGSGSASRDTNLYRNAADQLKTDDSLVVATRFAVGQALGTDTIGATCDGTISAALFKNSAAGTATLAVVKIETSATGKRAFDYRVTGDAVSRIRIDTSATGNPGTIVFGDGTTADVNLYRSAANVLKTDDDFVTAGALSAASAAITGAITAASEAITAAAASTDALTVKVSGDSNQRIILNGDGTVEWGSGSGAVDTNLYRSAADTLKTDDAFIVGGNLSVSGNFTTLGMIAAKGDLLVGTANDTLAVRSIGNEGEILTADPAQSDGLKWAPAPAPTISGAASQVGNYFVMGMTPVSTQALTGSYQVLYLFPYYLPPGTAVDRIALEVTTLGTGVVRQGIYANDPATGLPVVSAPLYDFGTVDVTSAAIKETTISATLSGWHWYGHVWQVSNVTAPTLRIMTQSFGIPSAFNLASSAATSMSAGRYGYYATGVSGALGAITIGGVNQIFPPRLAYRRA